VSEEDKSWAASEIEKMLDAGESRGEVIHWAATVLASINPSNTHWGAAAQQFNNKVEVAAYYSIDQGRISHEPGCFATSNRKCYQ